MHSIRRLAVVFYSMTSNMNDITLAEAAISWLSQRQASVTISTTEAELVAATKEREKLF